MEKIRIRHLILTLLVFVQCTVDDEDSGDIEFVQENLKNEVLSTNNSPTDNSNTETQTSFEHQKMLINWVDNIILPSLSNFESSLTELEVKTSIFKSDPTIENLSILRASWLDSFLKWQHVEMFDIGVAEEIYYKNRINLYPTNVEKIERNILNQNYDLNQSSNFSSQGFNGLDYLLFGVAENDDEIILKYSSEESKYSKYLIDLVDNMIDLTKEVQMGWSNEFRESFINSTDNTSTSSINKIINDFIYYFEKGFRANKIGIPAGVFSNNPLPDRVEAYHSKIYSKALSLEATYAIENFFNGIYSNDKSLSGLSINEYLNFIEADQDEKLANRINEQIEEIKVQLGKLNNDFSVQVNQDNLTMLTTYDVIQKTVVLLKVDMLQKLNISVDYADADGD